MKAYFEDGVDLSKKENLIAIAGKVGLSKEKVRSLLESGQGVAEVELAEEINHQRGINGVPFYIINNKYGISGAQSPAIFVKTLTDIAEKMK